MRNTDQCEQHLPQIWGNSMVEEQFGAGLINH